MYEFGLTREQLGQIALNGRATPPSTPKPSTAIPIDLADYLDARMISTPCACSTATPRATGPPRSWSPTVDYAPATRRGPACHVNAVGTALRGRPSWDQFDDMTSMAARDAAASMWERTDLRPTDVDVAQLYDGFSILTMVWLEALGFCGRGESGPFRGGRGGHRPGRRRFPSTPPADSCPAGGSTASG
jgi:hypothetical protein